MRSALWILLLLALCAVVWLQGSRFTARARAERELLRHGRPSGEAPADGWGRAVVGEASGAPLVDPAPGPAPAPPRQPGARPDVKPVTPVVPAGAVVHVVAAGESLSTICQARYGTARADLVAAVARYNRIDRLDQIRAGSRIVLPALSELSPKRP